MSNLIQFEATIWAKHNTYCNGKNLWLWFEGWENPEEVLQPMRLHLSCGQFEGTFENTQWRKQMQPM